MKAKLSSGLKIITLAIAAFAAVPSCHAVFNQVQVDQINCASQKLQLMFYYLDPKREPVIEDYNLDCGATIGKSRVKIPEWINEELPQMTSRTVWRDPKDGDLTEASVWQTPISLLYEFFDITKKTFPPSQSGQGYGPGVLIKEYSDTREKYRMSIDRVYRARLSDSMDGRGRIILSQMELAYREMEAASDAIVNNDTEQFNQAVTAIAVLSSDIFGQMRRSPRGLVDSKKDQPPASDSVPMVLKLVGMLVVFFGIKLVLDRKETEQFFTDYMVRSKQWTDAFNRQFMQIKIQYLVVVPIGLFALAGMLTFSFIGFVVLLLIGVYVGFHMPMWVLNYLKQRRGKKIDVQLMDALILLSNSLKSGMDIVQGFELVSHDLLPPISDEFGLVIKNYQLGTPFERALEGMEERVASRLLSYMIKAIVLQRQVGGNLTKIFERIVENIREEAKLEEKTKALTAQQRIQSIVVGIMPWIMLGVMFVFQKDSMSKFYTSPVGLAVLLFCMVWIGIGMKVVSKLGEIRV